MVGGQAEVAQGIHFAAKFRVEEQGKGRFVRQGIQFDINGGRLFVEVRRNAGQANVAQHVLHALEEELKWEGSQRAFLFKVEEDGFGDFFPEWKGNSGFICRFLENVGDPFLIIA